MKLIIQNIDKLKNQFINQFNYKNMAELREKFEYIENNYTDELLFYYEDNRVFLDILHKVIGFYLAEYSDFFSSNPEITKECVLYSEYYWNHLFMERAKVLYQNIKVSESEEWQFHIIKQIDHCDSIIDCFLLEEIENNKYDLSQ